MRHRNRTPSPITNVDLTGRAVNWRAGLALAALAASVWLGFAAPAPLERLASNTVAIQKERILYWTPEVQTGHDYMRNCRDQGVSTE
jgi:hypothetical protein